MRAPRGGSSDRSGFRPGRPAEGLNGFRTPYVWFISNTPAPASTMSSGYTHPHNPIDERYSVLGFRLTVGVIPCRDLAGIPSRKPSLMLNVDPES